MTGLKNLILLFLVVALQPMSLSAQDQVESILVINEPAGMVSIDPIGNVILLTASMEIKKFDRKGVLIDSYSDNQLSDQSEITTENPFKCMIYYPEYELIRVFGNKLQVLAELNLTLYGFGEVTSVAPSTGYQSFWVFDATSQKLIRINQQYEIVDGGSDLIPLLGEPIFPTMIKEREGWVYVYDPEKGMYVFDNFGAFSRKLNVPKSSSFSVFRDHIFFISEGKLYELDALTGMAKPLKIELNGKILSMTFRQLALSKNGTIEVIRF